MKKVKKPHACGTWTDARKHSFLISLVRSGTMKWKPKRQCIKDAYVKDGVNPVTDRKVKLYACRLCPCLSMQKDMRADHIEPIVPVTGFTSWDEVFARTFVEVEGFQAVCVECHSKKTEKERVQRAYHKKLKSS